MTRSLLLLLWHCTVFLQLLIHVEQIEQVCAFQSILQRLSAPSSKILYCKNEASHKGRIAFVPNNNILGTVPIPFFTCQRDDQSRRIITSLSGAKSSNNEGRGKVGRVGGGKDSIPELERIPSELEGVAIPFVDQESNSFIECYADSVTTVDGIEYTIGVPCDYSVALCYYDDDDQLVPIELDDDLMDDIFSVAESIVTEEYGEDLSLQRTPQTLTLVGELDDDDDEEDEDDEDDDDEEDDEDEEEVEVLLSFEHRGKEFTLVRLLDPILLVGKKDLKGPGNRILLTPAESEMIMPLLEEAFVEFHDDEDSDDDDEYSRPYEISDDDYEEEDETNFDKLRP